MKEILTWLFSIALIGLFILPAEGADCEKAKAYFEQALKLSNDTPSLITKEQLYQKSIDLCPSFAEAHNNLGDVYENQGRVEEAIAQYKKAKDLKPKEPYPYFGLGDIYYKTGRYEDAIRWYKEGLKYEPDDKLTRDTLALIKDIQRGGVIKAETIRGMLSTSLPGTRGAGEVVSITFGEGLIPFDYNKSNIRPDSKAQLDEIGKALKDLSMNSKDISVEPKDNAIPVFEIAGHTDCRGTDEYNLTLSSKRAEAVVDYLVTNFNISRERLKPVGYGERVPLFTAKDCSKTSSEEGGHALNRRVEIVKKATETITERGLTRTIVRSTPSFRGGNEPNLAIDTGFFCQKNGERLVRILKEESSLRSKADKYFIFFRPFQDCYVYILQEDSKGTVDLLFPKKGDKAFVKKDVDYWVPAFGKGYTLDDTAGEEKLYLVATSWELENPPSSPFSKGGIKGDYDKEEGSDKHEDDSLKEKVQRSIKGLSTRAIKVVPPSQPVETIAEEELKKPQKIDSLIERVEGEGGWVKIVRFGHE